jgi:hypothetical protein
MPTLTQVLGAGKPRAAQLNIGDIFSFADALRQRGLFGISDSDVDATLVNSDANAAFATEPGARRAQLEIFLAALATKEYRKALRAHIYDGKAAPSCPDLGLLEFLGSGMEQRYTRTFEVLLAFLSVQELGALSAGFGVHIDGAPEGGDFDCIASFRDMLLYLEVKSGEHLKRNHIETFVQRHCFLHTELSALLIDYQGIDEALVRSAAGIKLYDSHNIDHIRKLERGREVFYTLEPNLVLVDLHRSGDVLTNIRSVMRYYWGYEALVRRMDYQLVEPEQLGYTTTVLVG